MLLTIHGGPPTKTSAPSWIHTILTEKLYHDPLIMNVV